MKKFLIYILGLLLSFGAINLMCHFSFDYAFDHMKKDTIAYYRYIFEKNRNQSDIFIVGASKACHHYNPQQIENSLHMTCFNGGQDGQNINYQYLSIRRALQNGPVKYVILDIGSSQLSATWRDRIDYQKIFYWKNNEAADYVNNILGSKAPFLMTFAPYRYNSRIIDIIGGAFLGKYGEKGYVPLTYTGESLQMTSADFKEVGADVFVPDSLCLVYLEKCVNICKEAGVQLILCVSPFMGNDHSFSNYIDFFAKKHGVIFWDDSNHPLFMSDLTLFKDSSHLNEKGAQLYTDIVISRLKLLDSK